MLDLDDISYDPDLIRNLKKWKNSPDSWSLFYFGVPEQDQIAIESPDITFFPPSTIDWLT